MPTFENYFFGLICIHGASIERDAPLGKTRALLLNDSDHEPFIYLNGHTEERLTHPVSFSEVPTGEARPLPSFLFHVPHLVPLTRDFVKLRPNAPGLGVTLPAGPLATVHLYRDKGRYVSDAVDLRHCVGRLTLLQVTTTSRDVMVHYNNSSKPVPSDGFVLIINRDKRDSHAPATSERPNFKKHHVATTGSAADLATLYELTDEPPCGQVVPHPGVDPVHLEEVLAILAEGFVADHPECSNTQWP